MRLFVAIEIPDDWREAAARAAARLTREAAAPLRLVRPEAMHLTLRFFGELQDETSLALHHALEWEVPPFDLELVLDAGGTFGPPARTQVVWLGIGGDVEVLRTVVEGVESAATVAGLPREARPLSPHLTLARVGRDATPDQRREVAAAAARLEAPGLPFEPRQIALVRSHLGGHGPRYEVLARYP